MISHIDLQDSCQEKCYSAAPDEVCVLEVSFSTEHLYAREGNRCEIIN